MLFLDKFYCFILGRFYFFFIKEGIILKFLEKSRGKREERK